MIAGEWAEQAATGRRLQVSFYSTMRQQQVVCLLPHPFHKLKLFKFLLIKRNLGYVELRYFADMANALVDLKLSVLMYSVLPFSQLSLLIYLIYVSMSHTDLLFMLVYVCMLFMLAYVSMSHTRYLFQYMLVRYKLSILLVY